MSCRWGGSVQKCGACWFIYMKSDQALVLMRLPLQLNDCRCRLKTWSDVQSLFDSAVCTSYEQKLLDELSTPTNCKVDEGLEQIKQVTALGSRFCLWS